VAPECLSSCGATEAFYFTVEAISDVLISGISFEHYVGVGNVAIYTAPGGYSDKYSTAAAWNNVFSASYNVDGSE
jgi:hypothetical protein